MSDLTFAAFIQLSFFFFYFNAIILPRLRTLEEAGHVLTVKAFETIQESMTYLLSSIKRTVPLCVRQVYIGEQCIWISNSSFNCTAL